MIRLALIAVFAACLAAPATAQDAALRELSTNADGRGWEAVGRLDLGRRGFCTATLIEPQLVLTAAHCLFDRDTGQRIDASQMQFMAGLRNGRAEAYRGVRRAVAHPDYAFKSDAPLRRVASDLALIELDQPISLPSIRPLPVDRNAQAGSRVGVVSYARARAEAPSLQEMCRVLGRQSGVLLLSCVVDFGASGAPVFTSEYGAPRIVSVVSAMAELDAEPVALSASLRDQIGVLRQALSAQGLPGAGTSVSARRAVPGDGSRREIGARFIRP